MTWGVIIDVPAPVEFYDAVHAEVLRRSAGTHVEGLLLHLARPTDGGFQVVEVWVSREGFERYNRELVDPVVAELSGGRGTPPDAPAPIEFQVRGLVIPGSGIAR